MPRRALSEARGLLRWQLGRYRPKFEVATHRAHAHRPIPPDIGPARTQCPAHIRASWTRLHFGGDRPWLHCPHCERRVAKLYRGLAGYFCRACVGNPPYATQLLSAGGRAHFKACKLRLVLDGEAQLSRPFPGRPPRMHWRTYQRLRREGMRLEAGLSGRMRKRFPDYANLVAYTD